MPEQITLSELARRLGRSKQAIQQLADKGIIPRNADGSFDEMVARSAYLADTAPNQRKPLKPPADNSLALTNAPEVVETLEEARDAVSLIRRVLAEEGRGMDGAPSYDDVRTAETILKARERAQAIAVGERELIRKAPVMKHIEEAFANFRKELQAMPARYGAQIAAEAGCDVGKLDAALSKVIREQLDSLSAPLVRD
jgi:hypothetical protein